MALAVDIGARLAPLGFGDTVEEAPGEGSAPVVLADRIHKLPAQHAADIDKHNLSVADIEQIVDH